MNAHLDPLERALRAARDAEPPALPPSELDSMLSLAIAARHLPDEALEVPLEAPPATTPSYRGAWIALAAAAVVAAFAAGLLTGSSPDSHASTPARNPAAEGPAFERPEPVELSGGDRLSLAPGTEYVVEGTFGHRTLRMDGGTLLVDAAHRGPAERLLIVTPHGDVRVVGTVFTVNVDGERAVVRVYEGRVVVVAHEGERSVAQGGSVSVSLGTFELAPEPSDGERWLSSEASRAVRRRVRAPRSARAGDVAAPHLAEIDRSRLGTSLDSPVAPPAPGADESARQETPAREALGSATPRPAFARLWIVDGQPGRALDAARRALASDRHEPTWRMVEGDALRALGQPAEAAVAYERAAAGYGPALAARAALAAAELRLSELGDATGALRVLVRYQSGAEPLIAGRIERLRAQIQTR